MDEKVTETMSIRISQVVVALKIPKVLRRESYPTGITNSQVVAVLEIPKVCKERTNSQVVGS